MLRQLARETAVSMLRLSLFLALSTSARSAAKYSAKFRSNAAHLNADDAFIPLSQADFEKGTYRITTSGKYRLSSDIVFSPRPDNDYWNVPGDPSYPMGQFYLGFFAAITVEANDVELDLNGFTISMSKEFYLLQRFFNVIQLNDRVFVDNQGVSSLNFQKGDKLQDRNGTIPGLAMPSNVYIHDGTLGLSSHAGIHSNGASNVRIHHVVVRDFEVAGIQCNGCKNVEIRYTTVGPSSKQVPVLATFANARFLDLMLNDFVPHGFAREGFSALLQETISFADRPGVEQSMASVFAKVRRATQLFRDHYMGRETELGAEDAALLQEARRVFTNDAKLPDGAALYGIFVNHLGVPVQDQNFVGGEGFESQDIVIEDCKVVGLEVRVLEVPALQQATGRFAQGPHRDLLRVVEMASDKMTGLVNSEYRGSFLDDVYFAMWKLSNRYYTARVYDSACGNFASNGTSTRGGTLWFRSDWEGSCTGGAVKDTSLTGRDVTMLQKRYFGGLSMSQALFEWATVPGRSLHELFLADPESDGRRSSGHTIKCDFDTMFHNNHGVVGVKVQETVRAQVRNVRIASLHNSGDRNHWVCSERYELPNSQAFMPAKPSGAGATARGLEVVRSDEVEVKQVVVDGVTSEEGMVIGVDIADETNDRSAYEEKGLRLSNTTIRNLRGGSGNMVFPTRIADKKVSVPGIAIDDVFDLQNNFRQPKHVIHYGWMHNYTGEEPEILDLDGDRAVEVMMTYSKYNTEAKVADFRAEAVGFYRKQFGVIFPANWRDYDVRHYIPAAGMDGRPGPILLPVSVPARVGYHAASYCGRETGCTKPTDNAKIHDFFWGIVWPEGPGSLLGGVFGGDQGQWVNSNGTLLYGEYSIENLPIPGVTDRNLEVKYYSMCPLETFENSDGSRGFSFLSFYINCGLESGLFGRGRSMGHYIFAPEQNGREWRSMGRAAMVFDDNKFDPEEAPVKTSAHIDSHWPDPEVHYSVLMDGTYKVDSFSSGADIAPILYQHHYLHEAGIYFLRRTSINTEAEIRALRRQFLTSLRDDWGIAKADPDMYEALPLENQIDLGGGNTVAPYEVNKMSNLRCIAKRRSGEMLQFGDDARVHEGGFRLAAGPAGITTNRGYIPFGSMVMQGLFKIENDPDFGDIEIPFRSLAPVKVNSYKTASIVHAIEHPYYGEGLFGFTVFPTMETRDGMMISGYGYMVFGTEFDADFLTAFLSEKLREIEAAGGANDVALIVGVIAAAAGAALLLLFAYRHGPWRMLCFNGTEEKDESTTFSHRSSYSEFVARPKKSLALSAVLGPEDAERGAFAGAAAARMREMMALAPTDLPIEEEEAEVAAEGAQTPAGFYRNKGILLTGATGFLGKILLEKLLRSIDLGPEGVVMVLLRADSEEEVQEKLRSKVLASEAFGPLRGSRPDFDEWARSKVQAVRGDLMVHGLGLSDGDRSMLAHRTHVIIHMAANVKFDGGVQDAVRSNALGTLHLVQLAKECAALESVVHVSTAYVNSNRPSGSAVAEQIYMEDGTGRPFDAKKELSAILAMSADEQAARQPKILRKWPNTYTFSKFLAEHLAAGHASKHSVPLTICRPSIVGAAVQEPMPGWIDSNDGASGGLLAMGLGAKQVWLGRGDMTFDVIPADICCSSILLAAALRPQLLEHSRKRSAERHPYAASVPVVNVASSTRNPITYHRLFEAGRSYFEAVPLSKQARAPQLSITSSPAAYRWRMAWNLELPRVAAQVGLTSAAARKKLVKASAINEKLHVAFRHFTTRSWRFDAAATERVLLPAARRAGEAEQLWADVADVDWEGYGRLFAHGLQRYLLRDWSERQTEAAVAAGMDPVDLASRALKALPGEEGEAASPSSQHAGTSLLSMMTLKTPLAALTTPRNYGRLVADDDDVVGRPLNPPRRSTLGTARLRHSPGLGLSWRDLSYSVAASKGPATRILDGVSGVVKEGEVLAVMGPSGSGKTSLLSLLADRVAVGQRGRAVSGSIKLGAERLSGAHLRKRIGYVAQEDVLLGAFTVLETLRFAAALSLSGAFTAEEREVKVQEVLDDMGLRSCKDTKVGDIFFKGISGGQKRRLSIAIELLRAPPVLILDEPTSGLDSAAAMVLLQHLRHLARNRRTAIILSIHQPSAPMTRLFTHVTYLANGRTVYFGPPGKVAIAYFTRLGHPSPQFENPVEFHLSLINSDFTDAQLSYEKLPPSQGDEGDGGQHPILVEAGDVAGFAEFFARSSLQEYINRRLADCETHAGGVARPQPAPMQRQVAALARRFALNNVRHPGVYGVRVLMHCVLSVLLGLFYNKDNFTTYIDKTALLFSHFAYLSLLSVAVLPALSDLRLVFQRERASFDLSVSACVFTQFVTGLPLLVTNALLSTALVIYTAGFESEFLQYALTMFLALTVSESWMHVVGALAPHFMIGLAVSACLYGVFMLTSGFLMAADRMPAFLAWTNSWSFMKYGFEALLYDEFSKHDDWEAAATLEAYGASHVDVGMNRWALVVYSLALEVVFGWIVYVKHTARH